MKAIDYFEKYKDKEITIEVVRDLLIELSEESKEMMLKRKCKTNSAVMGTLNEFNQKYNKIVDLLNKHKKQEIFKRNGFIDFWNTKLKEEQ